MSFDQWQIAYDRLQPEDFFFFEREEAEEKQEREEEYEF